MTTAQTLPCPPVHLGPRDWLALQLLALWPHGAYLARRAVDGSDDPLGLLALAVLAALVAHQSKRLRLMPRLGWLSAALLLSMAANVGWVIGAPALLAALLAALAMAAALCAWWPTDRPRAPLLGLVLLSLPLIASLQYYVGWPLRVVTAQLSAWGLQAAGWQAHRSGASMLVNGQLVIVDAPCSGVQMAWLAYFAACAAAAGSQMPDGHFLRRLPWVGLGVLGANVLRNTLLVALETRPQGLSPALHESIGLLMLGLVVGGVLALTWQREPRHAPTLA